MSRTIFNTEVSFIPHKEAPDSAIKKASLGQLLVTNKWRKEVEAVRAETDPYKRRALKEKLPCFTPSGTFKHIAANGLIKHSGFISVDIDYKPEKGINSALADFDLKRAVADLPQVAYCGRSCGGAGYVLIIPIADTSKHKQYFRALSYHFERAGLEIDQACKDLCRKRFVSWDPEPYINTAARPWDITPPEREPSTRELLGRDLDLTETTEAVEVVIAACEQNKWDITQDYNDWIRILAAIAETFGENGRSFAHRISAISPEYNPDQTDQKYSSFLKPYDGDKVKINTFFRIARYEMGKHDFDNLLVYPD